MHGGDAAARSAAAAGREELQRVGQFGQVTDPVHAVRADQRLPRAIRRGQRARVRRDQRLPGRRPARAEQDDRHVRSERVAQHFAQLRTVPDRLEDQGQHPGLGQAQRVPREGRGAGDEFLPGRGGQGEPEPAARVQHRGEHRPGVGDQGDRPGRHRVGQEVADGEQPAGQVHEPHAPRPAESHARVLGGGGQAVSQPGGSRGVEGTAKDDGRTSVGPGRRGQLLLQRGVRYGQHGQVDRLGQVGEPGQAADAADVGVPRVHQVGARPGRAPADFADHPLAEAARARAGADQGDAACLQHRPDGSVVPRVGLLGLGLRGQGRRRHRRPGRRIEGLLMAVRRSAIAALAACMPGMPHTPPPPWVAELA